MRRRPFHSCVLPRFAIWFGCWLGCASACSSSPTTDNNGRETCSQNVVQACVCEADGNGSETCLPDGTWSSCYCGLDACVNDQDCVSPNICTNSTCSQGRCSEAFTNASCDDESACTQEDQCNQGVCEGIALRCEDGNACTRDACDVDAGCTHDRIAGCCATSEECDDDWVCIAGECAPCGNASGALPDGLTTIEWNDGMGTRSLVNESWTVTDEAIPLASAPLHESVRFALHEPTRVHGFSIQYAQTPSAQDLPVRAGIFPDFGHNGFNFWHYDAQWQGSQCSQDVTPGEWTTFVLEEPLAFEQPALIHVAHRRDVGAQSAWAFDNSTTQPDGSCQNFEDCHSAINLFELREGVSGGTGFYMWPGSTFPFQFDYMVRLHVEPLDAVPATDKVFRFQSIEDGGIPGVRRPAFGDFDQDGDDDLFGPGPVLYENRDGRLTDVTADSGLASMGIGASGGVWGDYDNDGCLDLFVFHESNGGPDALLRNKCDGTFENTIQSSGLDDRQDYNPCGGEAKHAPTPAAAWLDIDGDGFLDLYQSNFICWSNYTYYTDTVWRNRGDGTFEDWTGTRGFADYSDARRASRGAHPIDFDQDGDVDLFVNHYVLQANILYRNEGTHVRDVAHMVGAAGIQTDYNGLSYFGHSIGAAWGDLDGNGEFDLIVANLAHPRFYDFSNKTEVLLQNQGQFSDLQGDWAKPEGGAGIRFQETHSVPTLGDFDHDGNLDLIISSTYSGRPTDFYWGKGDGSFAFDGTHSGIHTTDGWGLATADIDQDGDLDLVNRDGIFLNQSEKKGSWLQIGFVDAANHRSGLGATIRVTGGGKTWIRHIDGGSGQGCQASQRVHIGLGNVDSVDGIDLQRIGAEVQHFAGPIATNQAIWLDGNGTVHMGWATP